MINTKKTQCMIFNKSGRLIRRPFYLNGVKLEMVRAYKYLGFVITPSGEINTGLKDLRDRAFKGFMKLRNDMGPSFNQDITVTLTLVDSLIKPILLYASDFWGCLKLPANNHIENLHIMMCKQILGVQTQTTNIGVLLELGRIPLSISAVKFALKNWERIRLGQGNEILTDAYKDGELCWDLCIKSHLESNGMLNFYEEMFDVPYPFIHKKLFERLRDNFHQNAFEKIRSSTSKLRTYALFKNEVGFEKYLTDMRNVTERILVTKFRLSNHRLMIEVGRHNDAHKDQRFCPFCPQAVENELHFMFTCPIYSHLRVRYLQTITNNIRSFEYLPHDRKMQILLTVMDQGTCKFIASSLELREFLASKPKFFD